MQAEPAWHFGETRVSGASERVRDSDTCPRFGQHEISSPISNDQMTSSAGQMKSAPPD